VLTRLDVGRHGLGSLGRALNAFLFKHLRLHLSPLLLDLVSLLNDKVSTANVLVRNGQ